MTHHGGGYFSLSILPATPLARSQALEGLLWGVTVPFKGPQPYLKHCFRNCRDTMTPSDVTRTWCWGPAWHKPWHCEFRKTHFKQNRIKLLIRLGDHQWYSRGREWTKWWQGQSFDATSKINNQLHNACHTIPCWTWFEGKELNSWWLQSQGVKLGF